MQHNQLSNMAHFFSALVWGIYGIGFLIIFPFVLIAYLLTAPFDSYRSIPNAILMYFGQCFTYLNPFWKIHFRGIENFRKKDGVIFMGNHRSFVDMPLLARLPWNMKWVSKKELFRVPVAGWILSLAGHISIDRGSPEARKSIYKIAPHVKAGQKVMVFPEGTRSRDGQIKPFKRGAFLVAWEHNLPIQPIVISGTEHLMRPGSWVMKLKGYAVVSILERISPGDFDSQEEFIDYTFQTFVAELDRLQISLQKAA